MAETKWTKAQQEAIQADQNRILVSAAAGSGKTAVLVERVIRLLTRAENPLDVDQLLIMTFTRAAAQQMKTKIYAALKEVLKEQPENLRIRQQMMKLQSARICTIDALCSSLVREHFQDIDLDPGFRIADEAQIRILRKEVLEQVLEGAYQEASEDFLNLAEYYMDKNDKKLEELILTMDSFAESHPEPEAWIRASVYPYLEAGSLYSGEESFSYPAGFDPWMPAFAQIVSQKLEEILQMAVTGEQIAEMNYGPYAYGDGFRDIQRFLLDMEGQSFDYRRECILEYLAGWANAPRISKKDEVDPDLKEQASDLRKEIKKALEDLRDNYLYDDLEGIFRDMAGCADAAATVADLTLRFRAAFKEAKKERGIADFSDISHYALQILIRYNEDGEILRDAQGEPCYTETADQMARNLEEIIVDEYQDTNMLQEYLVSALSGTRFGKPNVFMVGDVKQSIYGFRMACPELFNEKMEQFGQPESEEKLIILDRNFRSRKEVLDFTNLIFRQAMIRDVGGIAYQNGHDLVYSGIYGEQEEAEPSMIPEVLLLQGSGEQVRYLEGYRITQRIEQLTKEQYHYSDIVILTRTSDQPQLEQILYERGIPLIKSAGKGFFDSLEIRLFLSLLHILDNPYQDIPLAAVLYSPICHASAQDLARIHLAGDAGESLYECLKKYQETDAFRGFLEDLEAGREMASYMGIQELIERVLDRFHFREILASMPNGQDRLANLEFLKSLADSFLRSGSGGLFSFLRYIEELKESEIDFGTVNASSGKAEAVHMMTIHRSKGLEFPVVIVAGCGKKYNETDLNASIIPDRNLGVGMELRDSKTRMIRKTPLMQTIRQKQKSSNVAEELRLLYVALTRAKEKLILVGSDWQLDTKMHRWERDAALKQPELSASRLLQSGSFLNILGMTLYANENLGKQFTLEISSEAETEDLRVEEVLDLQGRREWILQKAAEEQDMEELEEQLHYAYPFRKAANIRGKISASQLENHADWKKPQPEEENLQIGPAEALSGAERGNAYHKFMELLDYQKDPKEQLEAFRKSGRMEDAAVDAIDLHKIEQFLRSSIGKRMQQAFQKGTLYRERQFVMGYEVDINAEDTLTGVDFHSDVPDSELLLVQGIIDAYFQEESEDGSSLILVDYKTDRNTDEAHYIHTYQPQLNAYADALERSLGMKVREKIIYSFELGREIVLEGEKR